MNFRKVVSLCAALMTIIGIGTNGYSQNSTDLASDAAYDDGFDNGDNGGVNFTAWDLTLVENSIFDESEALVQDATTSGGDASLNSGGRAFILRANEQGSGAAARGRRSFTPLIDGGKIRFRLQSVGDPTDSVVSYIQRSSFSPQMGVLTQSSSLNWNLLTASATDTGIPETSPIEVLITHNTTADFDIEITELVSPFTVYSNTGVSYLNAGSPDLMDFETSPSAGQDVYCIFNNLLVNPDGLLPVEISSFDLE